MNTTTTTSNSSETVTQQLTPQEHAFNDLLIGRVEQFLGDLSNNRQFTNLLQQANIPAIQGLGAQQQQQNAFQQRRGGQVNTALQNQAELQANLGTKQGQQANQQVIAEGASLLQRGGLPSEAQSNAIRQAAQAAFNAGQSNLQATFSDTLGTINRELAPGRGLRGTDSPIRSEAGLVGREFLRSSQQLASDIGAQELATRLSFPTQQLGQTANIIGGASGHAAQTAADFSQRAFTNRLNAIGAAGNQGLGLGNQPMPLPQFERTTTSTGTGTQTQKGSLLGGIFSGIGAAGSIFTGSSKTLKMNFEDVDPAEIVEKIKTIPIQKWQYKDGRETHIGPFAEELEETFGVGNQTYINFIDIYGVTMAGMKNLIERVERLENGTV